MDKNMNPWHELYTSLFYPMILYQTVGCVPFNFSKNGIDKSILRYLFTEIQNLIYLATFLWAVYVFNLNREPGLQLHVLFLVTVLFFGTVTIWIESAVTIEKWTVLFQELLNVDKELIKYNIEVKYSIGSKKSLVVLAGQLIVPTILFLAVEDYVNYITLIIIYFFPHWIVNVTGYIYCEMVMLITEKFTILNNILQKLSRSNYNLICALNDDSEEKSFNDLCRVCTWHYNLTKSIELLNDAFGFRMVANISYSFTILAMHIFLLCRYFTKGITFGIFFEYGSLILSFGYNIYRMCKACEYSVKEAKKSGSLIHLIKSSEQFIIDEIEMFSIQMLNEDIEYSAAGFFPINFSLLFSMIGGVTTYTIILIQLQDSSTEETTTQSMISTNMSAISYL